MLLCAIASICKASAAAHDNDSVTMIPKYKQHNHDQMILGARLAQRDLRKNEMAPKVVAAYPSRDTSKSDQISFVRDVTNHGNARAILLNNLAGEEIEEFTLEAYRQGVPVVTYDSPLKGGRDAGESVFVSPVDFGKTGLLMADMALSILGDEGGDFVIQSTTRTSANQNGWIASLRHALTAQQKYSNLRLVGEEVYYPSEHNDHGHETMTLELVELKLNNTLPNLQLIMAPTSSGAARRRGHCTKMGTVTSCRSRAWHFLRKCWRQARQDAHRSLRFSITSTLATSPTTQHTPCSIIISKGRRGKGSMRADWARKPSRTIQIVKMPFASYPETSSCTPRRM